MFRCKVSEKVDELEKLHKKCSWIPGKDNIRPNKDIIEKKENYLNNLQNFYVSEKDYILSELFNFNYSLDEKGKIWVKKNDILDKNILIENVFRYNIEKDTKHYVMWYSYSSKKITDKKINNDIKESLEKIVDGKDYDYVWYENPKKNIQDIFHVHVFWILKN